MAFTDIELAVLSQLAYKDPTSADTGATLAEFIKKNEKYLKNSLGDSYHGTIDSLIEKTADCQIIHSVNDNANSGFAAFAVQDPSGEVTVACRGTEMNLSSAEGIKNTVKDVYTDLQIGTNVTTNQQEELEKFIKEIEKRDDVTGYSFTGHSLGGNLAMHGAAYCDPALVKNVRVYNAPGFNDAYLEAYGYRYDEISGRIVSYQNEADAISSIYDTPGNVVIVDKRDPNDGDFLSNHSICNFKMDENGNFVPNGTGKKDEGIRVFDKIIDSTGKAAWFINGSDIHTEYIGRDFREEKLEAFIDSAKEVEEEKWWDITRWDCWYRAQNIMGLQGLDLLTGNIDSYYRKLIDVNCASVEDIKRIFEEVYAIDEAYKNKFQNTVLRIKQLSDRISSIAEALGSNHSKGGMTVNEIPVLAARLNILENAEFTKVDIASAGDATANQILMNNSIQVKEFISSWIDSVHISAFNNDTRASLTIDGAYARSVFNANRSLLHIDDFAGFFDTNPLVINDSYIKALIAAELENLIIGRFDNAAPEKFKRVDTRIIGPDGILHIQPHVMENTLTDSVTHIMNQNGAINRIGADQLKIIGHILSPNIIAEMGKWKISAFKDGFENEHIVIDEEMIATIFQQYRESLNISEFETNWEEAHFDE